VYNPVADWVSLDEHVSVALQPTKPKKPIIDPELVAAAARELIDTRTQLFSTPSGFFDPFASPTLFLRAPGRDTPATHTEALGLLDPETEDILSTPKFDPIDDLYANHSHSPSHSIHDLPTPPPTPAPAEPPAPLPHASSPARPVRRRKVLRRWPPVGRPEDVLLPHIHIFTSSPTRPPPSLFPHSRPRTGLQYILTKQAEELATLLRRACFWGRESGFAEERVRFTDLEPKAAAGSLGVGKEAEGHALAAAEAMGRWLRGRADADAEERAKERSILEEFAAQRREGRR
jgi:hypothetical protein